MASAKGFTAPGENFQQDVVKWLEKNGGGENRDFVI